MVLRSWPFWDGEWVYVTPNCSKARAIVGDQLNVWGIKFGHAAWITWLLLSNNDHELSSSTGKTSMNRINYRSLNWLAGFLVAINTWEVIPWVFDQSLGRLNRTVNVGPETPKISRKTPLQGGFYMGEINYPILLLLIYFNFRPFIGVMTLFITARGPPLRDLGFFLRVIWNFGIGRCFFSKLFDVGPNHSSAWIFRVTLFLGIPSSQGGPRHQFYVGLINSIYRFYRHF